MRDGKICVFSDASNLCLFIHMLCVCPIAVCCGIRHVCATERGFLLSYRKEAEIVAQDRRKGMRALINIYGMQRC